MDFITGAFLLFFMICVAVYYSIPKKGQWIWLLLCSIFFYLCASVKLSIFILFSIISSFVAARRLEQLCAREQAVREKTDPDQKKETDVNVHKKAVAALLIGSNAGLLFLLKFASSGSFFVTRLHLGRLALSAADGNFLLYAADHCLCGRCLSRKISGGEEFSAVYAVCDVFSADPAGTDRKI